VRKAAFYIRYPFMFHNISYANGPWGVTARLWLPQTEPNTFAKVSSPLAAGIAASAFDRFSTSTIAPRGLP
jgi:hypothetical protein